MSTAHRFNVDVTNPGQFLACCGILELANCLELADCLNGEATGYFDNNAFVTAFDPCAIMRTVVNVNVDARQMSPQEFDGRFASAAKPKTSTTIDPIKIGAPFDFEIDWWLKPRASTEFKTWSGDKQIPSKILQSLLIAISEIIQKRTMTDPEIMNHLFTSHSELSAQPFYFDGVHSRHPRDIGFSIADLKSVILPHCACTEFLAFVGLQRFEPRPTEIRSAYQYWSWHTPLPVNIAAAVAYGHIPAISPSRFVFSVSNRDDYHKQFSAAKRSTNV